ncbi:VPLPA-CTERM sorting domain-containing protein [Epibacterium sp. SM1969]|uniref:VPLPA-CTERM sorting domain-containing protein n=1 Tax=Tritonibacter aquimaris TaxID=2663379 RepID=A0A844AZ60_9RHOB|nr:VPLPA-CTERM sorting domain-containing protein [Tritonibacter aquimaris]MQY43262.1 VPLPA-CTERM sorting domain-containing protein [Tritonibacter aquimaris]
MKHHILAAALCLASAAGAQAATIAFGPTAQDGAGPNIEFNNLLALPTVIGNATFTFSVRGDLNWFGEYVDVSIDGFSLGRVFDNNPRNDAFDFYRDRATQQTELHTGSATIDQSVFANLVSDGELNILFDFSPLVDWNGAVRHLSGSITYDAGVDNSIAPVPLPASAALLIGGLFGLGALRRRKKATRI